MASPVPVRGDLIREIRERRGIASQRALARETGLDPALIVRAEKRGDASFATCLTLADYFGITIDELVARPGSSSDTGHHSTPAGAA